MIPIRCISCNKVLAQYYDEIENLERWQEVLTDMISNNTISQEEYDKLYTMTIEEIWLGELDKLLDYLD